MVVQCILATPIHVFVSSWSLLSLFIEVTFASSVLWVLILNLTSLLSSCLHFNQQLCMRWFVPYICTSVSAIITLSSLRSLSYVFCLRWFPATFFSTRPFLVIWSAHKLNSVGELPHISWFLLCICFCNAEIFCIMLKVLKVQHLHSY